MIGFKSSLLVVPGARSLPVSTMEKLREFIESAGSALFIGGPLFYDFVEQEDGDFVKRPLENELDAAMAINDHYIREGLCPSYKTFDAKRVTRLKVAPGQIIWNGDLKIPSVFLDGISVTISCETGSQFWRTANRCRFIPLVECYSRPEADPLLRGLRNGRRGAFAFIELERTNSVGFQGKYDYGFVENTAVGSVVAMIGARCGLHKLAGADGLRYRSGETVRLGAEITNTSRKFREVVCKLIESGNIADQIASPISFEKPVETAGLSKFVRVEGEHFALGGRRWYMAGINYWSTYSPAREKSDYWRGQFELANYNPETVEGDLVYAAELELNCLLTRVDFTDLDLAAHGLRDFLWRCEKHGLKVWLACRVYCSRFYDRRAVERLFELVSIKDNPTVMALDLEWESANDMQNDFICGDFTDEWEAWLIRHCGSIDKAEEKLGRLGRDRFGYTDFPTEKTLETAKALRHFTADSIDAAWERLTAHLRSFIPNQLLTFRSGSACPDMRAQAASFIDFSAIETYDVPCYGDLANPENARRAAARLVCSTKLEQYENGGKPAVWAEYGRSVCGSKWWGVLFYNHDGQSYLESEQEIQRLNNDTMELAMCETNVAGSASCDG